MRKYVLIPDSFKGTLSSREVCQIVAEAIRSQEPEAEICAIPVADGGEGTVDAFLSAVGGQQVPVACTGAIRRSHHRLLRPAAGTAPPWWRWLRRRDCPWWARTATRKRPPPMAWAS